MYILTSLFIFEVHELIESSFWKCLAIVVTENEIVHGILDSVADPKSTSLCIVRNIIDLKNHVERHPRAAKFADVIVRQSSSAIDTGTKTGAGAILPDDEADRLLRDLRDNKVLSRLSPENVSRYEIDWGSASFEDDGQLQQQNQLDSGATGNTKKNHVLPSSAATRHATYIDALCHQFYDSVTRLITSSCSRHRGPSSAADCKTGTAECRSSGAKFRGNNCASDAAHDDDDETRDEVLQHLHFAKSRCELFHGRQDTMTAVRDYLAGRSRLPLIVYGPSGCGKTSILAKTVGSMATWAEQAAAAAAGKTDQAAAATAVADCGENVGRISGKKKIVTIVRFLGTTPKSSNVRDLLSSLCRQLHTIYKGDLLQKRYLFDGRKRGEDEKAKSDKRSQPVLTSVIWQEPDKMSDLVAEFHRLLRCARRNCPLLLVLDSIDQLSPVYDAYRVTWLPIKLPLHVKLIVSTLVEGYDVFNNLRDR
jgi:hypothetical protein